MIVLLEDRKWPSTPTTIIRERFEQEKTHDFLLELDDDQYGQICSQILGMEFLPLLNKAFYMVSQEERHKTIVRSRDDKIEALTFVVRTTPSTPTPQFLPSSTPSPSSNRGRGRSGTRGRGRDSPRTILPFGSGGPASTYNATTANSSPSISHATAIPGFTTDQIQCILGLIEPAASTDKLLGKEVYPSPIWLIDNGASHHMTGDIGHLFACSDSSPQPVHLPNGLQTIAVKQGSVKLSSGLTHSNDRISKKVIGLGEVRNGVYVFRAVPFSFASLIVVTTSISSVLLHQRLGHPSSAALSSFPVFSQQNNVRNLQKGWKVLDLDTRELFISRDVRFVENEFPFASSHGTNALQGDQSNNFLWEDELFPVQHRGSSPTATTDPSMVEYGSAPDIVQAAPAPSTIPTALTQDSPVDIPANSGGLGQRTRRPPSYLSDYIYHSAHVLHPNSTPSSPSPSSGIRYPLANFVSYDNFSTKYCHFLANVTSNVEPRTYKEAVHDPCWRKAIQVEIDALEKNHTWDVVLPHGKHAIGCQWFFKIKYQSDGSTERHKARLVVLGNHQSEGKDFTETFAPVAKIVSVRTFLAVVVAKNWVVHQLDVNNVFLHGDLHEEVYMRLPSGFSSSTSNQVCRLRKSLNGLRQSPRNWFAKLTSALHEYGFTQSHADHTLFTYQHGTDLLAVLVYVDDILVATNNSTLYVSIKQYLHHCFQLKDLGPLKYFWVLTKPVSTPLPENHHLAANPGSVFSEAARYRRIVGRILYLTLTRPDIMYAVHILSQFMSHPGQARYDVATRVLRYLQAYPGQGLFLRANSDLQDLHLFLGSHRNKLPFRALLLRLNIGQWHIVVLSLGAPQFSYLLSKLGVRDPHAPP
ncbi:transmembrane signal receptor [Lithospermum erythrorhizon]|uniref:Transmembrane signal receptor n=1 Tax=Lithospermum erythrorhizon TaxID=34254 RepID=A0AAV3QLW9_LITER